MLQALPRTSRVETRAAKGQPSKLTDSSRYEGEENQSTAVTAVIVRFGDELLPRTARI
jgi:hypothetical protein